MPSPSHTRRDYSTPDYNPVAGWLPYPESSEEWRDLYDLRWQSYLLYPYGAQMQKNEHLFRAFDDSGNEIDQTRRLFSYASFIADTDARALHGGRLTLETQDAAPGRAKSPVLAAGESVWNRSKMGTVVPSWCRMLCTLGDWYIEPKRMNATKPYDVKLVAYDPRTVEVMYDAETGTEIVEAVITTDFMDQQRQAKGGDLGLVTSYKRVLTKTRIDVTVNGVPVPAESGEHGLGYVPLVHLRAIPFDQPEHSLPAWAGIERALMRLDSLIVQTGAIANRYGNPTLALYGFKVGAGSKVGRFGYLMDGIPENGKAEYVEAKHTSIPHLLETMREIHKHVRDTSPEFLFASDAAQESGEARSLRGQAFESKMLEMRGLFYAGLAEATAMAVALEAGRTYDPAVVPYRIDAPPIMPRNAKAEVELLTLVKDRILPGDFTRHLQRLGIVSNEHDPDTYAAEVEDRNAATATAFMAGGGAPPPEDVAAESGEEDDDEDEDGEELAAVMADLDGEEPDLDAVRESIRRLMERRNGR